MSEIDEPPRAAPDRPALRRRRVHLAGQHRPRPGSGPATALVTGAAAVIILLALIVWTTNRDEDDSGAGEPATSAGHTSPGSSAVTTASVATGTPNATASAQEPAAFGYQPLWPFPSPDAVASWQHAYRSTGSQPWHLDPEATAQAFTTGYLGFTDIDTVAWSSVDGADALVAVSQASPPGQATPFPPAAILHLARYGSGDTAPWEVVGSKDTTLTLTMPSYGAVVSTRVTVGGAVSGVDESLRVQVHDLGHTRPVGQSAPIPAGGDASPWSAIVDIDDDTGDTLTVVVTAGGHRAAVERFALTAIRRR